MTVNPSDISMLLPEFDSEDMFRRVGGFASTRSIDEKVDTVFLPGIIVGSDSSDSYRYQYRKVFVKNNTGEILYRTKVCGFNVKASNFVRFAIEKDVGGNIKLDGTELIKDYSKKPNMWNYDFTECGSDGFLDIGDMSDGKHIGLWLEQKIPKNTDEDPSDNFRVAFNWTDTI